MLWTLLVGLIVGTIAKLLMPGRDPAGFVVTMAIGVAGAFLASFAGSSMGWYRDGDGAGFVASVLGAVLLLAIFRAISGKKRLTT